MRIVIQRFKDVNDDELFEAYPEGEPELGVIGVSADALYETIVELGLDELRRLSDESKRLSTGGHGNG